MLLFQKRFHAGIVEGAVTATVRLWDKPRVKPLGRYRVHPIGVVEVVSIERRALGEVTEADAVASGFVSRDELLAYMKPVASEPLSESSFVFVVRFRHGGDGDRVPQALDDALSDEQVAEISERLRRFDAPGPWTSKVLALIQRHPRVAASQLAKKLGRETLPFKADVVKLKKLGLTQSFEVGYELSPRGRRYLELRSKRPSSAPKQRAPKQRATKQRATKQRAAKQRQ